jgi:hypothetical protein
VAQLVGDIDHGLAGGEQERSEGMPQVVRPDAGQARGHRSRLE